MGRAFRAGGNSAALWRSGRGLVKALTSMSEVGFMYRVDMRLRPWGRAGELVSSVDSHLEYLANNAQLWEKQALLKARVIAGDMNLGNAFLRRAESYLFNTPSEAVREGIRGMKHQIEAGPPTTGPGRGGAERARRSARPR